MRRVLGVDADSVILNILQPIAIVGTTASLLPFAAIEAAAIRPLDRELTAFKVPDMLIGAASSKCNVDRVSSRIIGINGDVHHWSCMQHCSPLRPHSVNR